MTEKMHPDDRARHRDWQPTATLILSIAAIIVALSRGWTSQGAVVDFHEKRITALESWQAETRVTLHEMDKKLDKLLQRQAGATP